MEKKNKIYAYKQFTARFVLRYRYRYDMMLQLKKRNHKPSRRLYLRAIHIYTMIFQIH